MTRGLSAAILADIGPWFWLAAIVTTAGDELFFWSGPDTRTIGSDEYLPYLRISTGFRHTRSLQGNTGEIELINTDLYIQTILDSYAIEGAKCTIYKYFMTAGAAAFIFSGILRGQSMNSERAKYSIRPAFNPSNINAIGFEYANTCQWRFGGGSVGRCQYEHSKIFGHSITVSELTADIYTVNTIGNSGASWTPSNYMDDLVFITDGTGEGQLRRIKDNTATTVTVYHDFETTPSSDSKFIIFSSAITPNGVPKQITTSGISPFSATADIATTRTIGNSGMSWTTDEHASDGDIETAGVVYVNNRVAKIKSNTATTLTLADDEADFDPVPTGYSFSIHYYKCPKDVIGCEQRGQTHRFGGFPTLTRSIAFNYIPITIPLINSPYQL